MVLVCILGTCRIALAGEVHGPLAGSVPYADYVTLIADIEATAVTGQPLDTLAEDLAGVTAVRLPDGTRMPVDNTALLSLMRQGDDEHVAESAGALLVELRAAIATPAAIATADAAQTRRDILADPNLQRPLATFEPPAMPNIPDVDLSFLRYVFIIAGVVAVIVAIVIIGPLLFRFFVTRQRRKSASRGDAEYEVATSVEAIERAQAASTIQDYRLALRMLYLASLLKLDEIGALRYDRALTNREYVRQVALKPALATALWPVVETFDDVWYGFYPVTPEGYGAFESKVNILMQAAEAEGRELGVRAAIRD